MRLPICEICEKPLRREDRLVATASHVHCVRDRALAAPQELDLVPVVIHNEDPEKKGRSFPATEVATIESSLWEGSEGGVSKRPCWALYAGSEAALKSFGANLRLGRRIMDSSSSHRRSQAKESTEFIKSAKYTHVQQRNEAGATLLVYLADLFVVDPGMVDPECVKFICSPSIEWMRAQRLSDEGVMIEDVLSCKVPGYDDDTVYATLVTPEQLAEWLPLAFLFAVYLDRRTRVPLLADGRFYLRIFLASLALGIANWASDNPYRPSWYSGRENFGRRGGFRFQARSVESSGMLPGVACSASHTDIEAMLASEVKAFLNRF